MYTRTRAGTILLVMIASVACNGNGPAGPDPQPQPQPLEGDWAVTHVRGAVVPAPLYVFDPTVLDGREVSVHFVVDSARIVIEAGGRYEHRVWVTQWLGEVGGPPLEPTLRFFHGDFGEWIRDGTALEFESHWLMNHRMTGSYASDGVLHMRHGFSHGDPQVQFRYAPHNAAF